MNVNKLRNLSSVLLFFLVQSVFGQANCDHDPDPCDGKTYTQGAWGAGNGNTASQYLNSHFNASFPSGLTIGCGTRKLKLTSASAIAAFLPSGSTPAILSTGTLTNPGGSYNNVLAGQLVTLILNATFDANDPNFSPSPIAISNYTIISGTFSGMTVGNLIILANNIIGGCSSQYSYSQLNVAIDNINNTYDNGNSNSGFLKCGGACNVIVNVSSSSILCYGGIATVTVSASGGTAPYTGTGTFTASAGSRTFSVTDAYGCQASKASNISQPSELSASSSCTEKACYGSTTNVTIGASGGTSPYTGTGVFSEPVGVHSFTVTDSKGCTDVTTTTILQYPQLTISAVAGNIKCFGGSTTVTISASGGTPPYNSCGNYIRSAGLHSFTVTDGKGCSAVTTITITQPSLLTGTISITNGSCSNNNLGSATVTAFGGTAPYSYLWTNNATSPTINNLAAGNYSLTLSDANACSIPLSTNITTVACCNVTSGGSINGSTTSCGPVCGVILGSASLPAGGLGATQFIWIKNSLPNYPNTGNNGWSAIPNSNSPTLSVGCVSVTTYYIRCSRKVNCSGPYIGESNMVSVIVNPGPIVSVNCNTTAICFGSTTTVNISATGGTAPYSGVGTFSVGAGPYSFTVTDANGCSGFVSGNINQSPALTGTISTTNGSCSNNNLGSATVTASGGTAPYSYLWTNNVTASTINNLAAGNYSLTLSDANSCSIPLSTNVTTVACCNVTSGGSINGSTTSCGPVCGVTLGSSSLPAGGIGATEFIWIKNSLPNYPNTGNNGWSAIPNSNSPTLSVGCVSVTTYYIRCSRKVSCGGPYIGESNMVSVIINPGPIVSANCNTTAICFGGSTTVNISATGGAAPYSGVGIFSVGVGPYSFTVTDANGCSGSVTGNINQSPALTGTISTTNGSCNNNNLGSATITASGGTAPYSYLWNNNATSPTINNLAAGNYSLTLSDANACSIPLSTNITTVACCNVTSGGSINGSTTSCGPVCGVTLGSSSLPAGGIGATEFIWIKNSLPNYPNTGNNGWSAIPNSNSPTLSVGCVSVTTYYIRCSRKVSCGGPYIGESNMVSVIINPGPIVSANCNTTAICFGSTTTLNISATGGTAPYSGTGIFTVSAGTHTYLITDANGCSATTSVIISQPSQVVASLSNGSILCNGGTTTVNISATGGTSPYTGTGVFTVSAGTHTYLITDANGCSATTSVTITEPTQLVSATTNGSILCNSGTTTVNVTANGGTVPYSGTGIFTVSAGTHTYLITDANGCSATTSVIITEPTLLSASATSGTILSFGGTTTVTISANGGTSPYTGTGTFTASSGTHTYLVTDANGCTATATITLTEPGQLVVTTSNGTILCNGGTTTVNISATGGVAPYSGVGTFTSTSGTHTYLVTDANNNQVTATVTITEPTQLIVSTTSGTILCHGGTTTVNISASGGTSPYTGTGIFTVSAGTHTYLITDANGCSATTSVIISQPSQVVASVSSGAILCNGGTTTVNVSSNGGTSPYSGTGIFTVSAGTHTYLITDANGCSATTSVIISEPTLLITSTTNGSILCNSGTTTVNVTANGGTVPYTGTGIFTVSAGTHTYLITDANGCSATTSVIITEPTLLTASATSGTILSFGGTTTVNISASGGTSPYTGAGTFTAASGTHTYLVTDANGCTRTATITLTEPGQLVVTTSNGTILCHGGTTTVNVSASGGVAPYTGTGTFTAASGTHTYLVTDVNNNHVTATVTITEPTQLIASSSNGSILCNVGTTTVTISANGGTVPYSGTGIFTVSAGTHTYLITDANGCSATTSVTITEPTQLVSATTNGSILCNSGTTTVNVTANGGTVPYTGTGILTVSAGTHTYLITDANGCSTTTSVIITEPTLLTASATSGTILSFGGTTTVNISANGGTSPYSGTGTFTAASGTHTYLVTDANGCTATTTITLTEPGQLVVTTSDGTILCHGGTTTVNVSASGGVAPYTGTGTFTAASGTHTYLVTDVNNNHVTATVTITEPTQLIVSTTSGTILCHGGTTTVNISASGGTSPYTGTGIFTVSAGTHTYLITDANGCSATTSVIISEPSRVVASSTSGTILCNGEKTTVNVSATGGTSPYAGTAIFTVSAGTHTYLITDANGCSATTSVIITEPTLLTASATSGTILSFGGTTTINVTANGGTSPYTGTGTFTASSGTHTYLVTDANGCTATATITLTEPGQLVVTTSNGTILCHGGTTTVNISATGGVAPYSGVGTFTATSGTHTYLVTDANNNQVTATVTITEPSLLVASSTNGSILCNGGTTTVNVSANGGTSPYSGTGIFTVSAGTHTYLITDANGCSATTSVTITEPTQLVSATTNGSILCNSGTTTVNVTANGGTVPYTGTGILTVSAGTHTYLITDANGCSTTTSVIITEPTLLTASATSGTILSFGGTTTVNISANGGTSPYSGTGTFTAASGTHTYLVTDANGCTATTTITLTEPGQLVVTTSDGTILCHGGTTTVNVSASGGVAPYSGIGTFTATVGTHTYLVTDANNNQVTATVTITEPSLLVASSTNGSILCNGGTTTVNVSANGGTSPYSGTGIFTVSAGTHTYLITDANGCSATTSVIISEPTLLITSTTNGSILCNSGTTTINVTANGGTSPYTGTGTFTASSGTHTYLITDANGCSATTSVTITEPTLLTASATSGTILSFGGTTTVNISASGGTSPYTGAGTFTAASGTHTYLVTDANGCTATATITLTEPGQLVVTTSNGTILCNGGTTTVNISATGGVAPYSGVGTFTATSGTHTYLVTDANNNQVTATVTITEPSLLVASASSGTILCNGGTTTVNISANGGTSPYTGTGIFTVSAGTHTYLITDANGCSTTTSVIITEPTLLTASATSGTILSFGGTTTVNISANSGTSPYSGTGTFTAASGTHTYLVTDANGCTATTTITLTEPGQLVVTTSNGTILCNGGTTTVNISASGGVSPYSGVGTFTATSGTHTYLVTDANSNQVTATVTITEPSLLVASSTNGSILCNGGTTTVNVSANGGTSPYTGTGIFTVSAGTHTYLITDANGCSATTSVIISEPSQVVASSTSGTILCNGEKTTVNVSATGGTSPYAGTAIFTVSAGTHTYLITDANGCSTTTSVIITEPTLLTASATSGTILSFGGTTTINVTANGGTSPYTGTGTFTASSGTHTYLVTDANGCTATATITLTEPGQLVVTTSNGTILCNGGTTTVNISATGGVAPYSGVGTFTSTSGTHTYLVTDANNNQVTATVTITEPTQLIVSTTSGTILCHGGTTTVNISASGGTSPYTGTGIFTVSAGTHTYLITDANGCSATTSVIISQPSQVVASVSSGAILCNGGTTTVNVSSNGGTSPYSGTGIFTVSAGTHTYLITDANGCSATTSVIISEPTLLITSTTNGSILCNSGTTTVNVTANGGTVPYTGTGIFTVSAGTHTYLITDANGCSATTSVIITEPTLLTASATSGTILSFGGTTTVNISASGGTSPYTGAGTFTAASGTHTYLVTDANGCTRTATITLTEPGQLVVTTSNGTILCHGGTTTVNVSASGGVAPYTGTGTFTAASGTHTYLVTDVNNNHVTATVTITEPTQLIASSSNGSILCNVGTTTVTISANGGTAPYSGTGVFTVSAGTNAYLVTDANGCSTASNVIINEPSSVQITITSDSINCHGGSTTATITASGGVAPYLGTGTNTVAAGSHTYMVTDANGCTTSSVLNIGEPSSLTETITVSGNILCYGDLASVDVTASGGTAPYQGDGNFSRTSGDYTFVVTDAMGCSVSSTINIAGPAALTATFAADSILCNGGYADVTITATGGAAPYSGTGIYSLPPGSHMFFVTDNNGCSVSVTRSITEPTPFIASFVADSIKCNGYFTTIRVTAWGGTAPYTGTTIDTVSAGTYNYLVTDANGCFSSTVITLSEPPPLVAGSIVNSPILCHGGFALVTVFATGGSGIYLDTVYADMPCMNDSLRNMLAANGGTVPYWGPDTYPVPAGSYTYGVVDSHCCWDTAEIVIVEPPELVGVGILSGPPCGAGQTSVTLNASGGTGSYTGLNTFPVAAGTHTYMIFDQNGCVDTVSVFVDGCTGIEENQIFTRQGALSIYPNPNNGTFKISGIEHGKASILNQSGQVVREIEFNENEEIVTDSLAEGMYFLVGKQWRVKMVVIRNY
ncbi:T9SS type A sorting domain-containing protein [Aurantibacillus circumpalustris]|uniref:T9SS type A sorting domain-containing protein n=1 Tax=Aurantibacillus circumpalustris TaxID=3036359 RepID=UPI00295BE80B|nr:T9SS type A sorting domain-containing protein [Aurantibacillus circumpalustris]